MEEWGMLKFVFYIMADLFDARSILCDEAWTLLKFILRYTYYSLNYWTFIICICFKVTQQISLYIL